MTHEFDDQRLNGDLLKYYSDMANHHRQKLTFFIGIFLALSQLIILTPDIIVQQLRDLQGKEATISHNYSIIGMAVLLYLLLLGVGHHICNFISANTCRIRHETYMVKDLLDSTGGTLDHDIERSVRPDFPLSRFTGPLSVLFGCVLYIVTAFQFINVVDTFLEKHKLWSIYGTIIMFVSLNLIAAVIFAYVAWDRIKQFYIAQSVLVLTRDLADENRLREFLQKQNVTLSST